MCRSRWVVHFCLQWLPLTWNHGVGVDIHSCSCNTMSTESWTQGGEQVFFFKWQIIIQWSFTLINGDITFLHTNRFLNLFFFYLGSGILTVQATKIVWYDSFSLLHREVVSLSCVKIKTELIAPSPAFRSENHWPFGYYLTNLGSQSWLALAHQRTISERKA